MIPLAFGLLISSSAAAALPPGANPPQMLERPVVGDRSAGQPERDKETRIPGRYIVALKDSVKGPASVARAHAKQHGGKVGLVYRHALKGYSAALSKDDVRALRDDPRVRYIVPDAKVEAFAQAVPTGIERIYATENEALDIDEEDDVRIDADVAVIDTGVDYEHPDLNVVERVNCVPNGESTKSDPFEGCVSDAGTDGTGHGTHVAGTIGALDNGEGVVGTAPGARVWAVRVLNNEGSGAISWIVGAVDWVTASQEDENPENDIEVANMSLGCLCETGYAKPMEDAISGYEEAEEYIPGSVDRGIVYVVAAGNNGLSALSHSPAKNPDVLTVSALADTDGEAGGEGPTECFDSIPQLTRTYEDDGLAYFSNWGSAVDVSAPGGCILSTYLDGQYETSSGTSMASPHVAGAAALATSEAQPETKEDVEAIRRQIADSGSLDFNQAGPASPAPLLHLGDALTTIEVSTGGAKAVEALTAEITGALNARGQEAEYWFEYGTDTDYDHVVPATRVELPAGTKSARVTASLEDLEPDTTYHYRLVIETGGEQVVGADRTFTSGAIIYTQPAKGVGEAGAILRGYLYYLHLPGATYGSPGTTTTYEFEYGLTASYDNVVEAEPAQSEEEEFSGGEFEFRQAPISGLTSATTYHYRIVAKNEHGTFYGRDQTFSTAVWSPWTELPTATPPLTAISCWEVSSYPSCATVSEEEGADVLLWTEYNEEWSTESVSPVVDAKLSDIACTGAFDCIAVGRGDDDFPVAVMDDYPYWSATSVPVPGEATSGGLTGVTCTSKSWCVAVGYYLRSNGSERGLALAWDGTQWEAMQIPEVGRLFDVTCTSITHCVSAGRTKPFGDGLILEWNGTEWIKEDAVLPAAASAVLSVSCRSPSFCMAATSVSGFGNSGLLGWNGEEWSISPSARLDAVAEEVTISGISCPAAWSCYAAGDTGNWLYGSEPLVVGWDGEQWTPTATMATGVKRSLSDVSCASAIWCLGVGEDYDPYPQQPKDPLVFHYQHNVSPPTAVTQEATGIGRHGAMLEGTVNGVSLPTTYQFEYGTTESYGSSVPASSQSIGSSSADIDVSESIEDLVPGTEYHFRVAATNAKGMTYGKDQTFTTLPQPTAAYSFDEGTGSTLHDSAGPHDGTIEGATWSEEGRYGSALEFDGTDDLVSVADHTELDLTDSFTLEAWIYREAGDSPVIEKVETSGGNSGYWLSAASFGLTVGAVYDDSGSLGGVAVQAVPTETWKHLAFTSDGTNLRLYVDGELVKTEPAIEAKATAAELLIGGSSMGGGYFDGMIDEVRIYDEGLSEGQIEADMEGKY